MESIRKNRLSIGLLIAFGTVCTPALQAYSQEYADAIANIHLQSFPSIEKDLTPEKVLTPQGLKDMWKLFQSKRELGLRELGEREKREMAFKQMPLTPQDETVIDARLVEKMLLVRGDTERATDHLMTRVTTAPNGKKLLQTTVGAKRFVEMLSEPTTNMQKLFTRQSIIKELVNNDELRAECSRLLETIKRVEPLVYDLYSRNQESETERMKVVDSQLGLTGTKTLTVTTRALDAIFLGSLVAPIIGGLGTYQRVRKYKRTHTQEDLESAIKWGGGTALYTIEYPLIFVSAIAQVKMQSYIRLNMQERLIGMATYLHALRELIYRVGKNSTISPLMPTLRTTSQKLYKDDEASKEFNKLNNLLRSRAFKREKPSIFSSPGTIINAYREMIKESVRKEYSAAMNLLGELDVYVALANKIKAHKTENAQFCFVEFIEPNDRPMLQATDFWNPFVDSKAVVGNDVSLNTGQERNIILTGPNTGGKSTIMKGLMFATLLGQTFGIAPARSMSFTPFAKLVTYLNISDDTGAGVSLFKAEINRAKEIIDTLRALKPDEFAFVILDETFTGTSPDKGEELSYKFISQLNKFKNCIFIDATHFKKITELEKATNGECKNYHTGVVIEDGRVTKYTYKLVPGVSPISTAEQIAQEEGILEF